MTETVTVPTFAARPVNGGPLEKALPKSGEWIVRGKYNGWRAWIHTPTRSMFNRKNEPLSIADEFKEALDVACRLPFEWLDVEALERRHKIGQGSLIILDTPILGPAEARYSIIRSAALGNGGCLEHTWPDDRLENNCVYLPLTLKHSIGRTSELLFWQALKSSNTLLGCEFWEGVVAVKNNSKYPIQLRNAEQDYPFWMKHRWAF